MLRERGPSRQGTAGRAARAASLGRAPSLVPIATNPTASASGSGSTMTKPSGQPSAAAIGRALHVHEERAVRATELIRNQPELGGEPLQLARVHAGR